MAANGLVLTHKDDKLRRWTLRWWDLHAVITTCGGWRWQARGWRHGSRRCLGRRRRRRFLICGERTAETSSSTTASTTPSFFLQSITRRGRAGSFCEPSVVVAGRRRWQPTILAKPGSTGCLGRKRNTSSYFGETIPWMVNGLARSISTVSCLSNRVCLGFQSIRSKDKRVAVLPGALRPRSDCRAAAEGAEAGEGEEAEQGAAGQGGVGEGYGGGGGGDVEGDGAEERGAAFSGGHAGAFDEQAGRPAAGRADEQAGPAGDGERAGDGGEPVGGRGVVVVVGQGRVEFPGGGAGVDSRPAEGAVLGEGGPLSRSSAW